ncbi:prevent-host-death family protein (plasmid) [Deinococcus proteolyticus MRP]|uniref:Prevent-host-death family protein n=1 Tax=Deinococcus proteolyticus (strain ATCC 35074 / DSM 20540 / JCM 6276 / NBRC 101906 / NCIMB 13154 / VKM Ac-1939 / CCM 2703 / MRP) TaxID=693977 RepID=F0RQH5_DEIPM|nr:type II toxin-antitoxin system prevent-host-death family antitoxin [Deinococcus proteolyticus]ADY27534.1 prevent-host-death family protein [Deinococcus proteolyticus MRP]
MSRSFSTTDLRQQSTSIVVQASTGQPVIITHYRRPVAALVRLSRLRELEATEAKYRALVQQPIPAQPTPARKEPS